MRARSVTIVRHADSHFDVFCGEDYTADLTWGEMLEQVVHLTHADIPRERYDIGTPEYYQERHERRMKNAFRRPAVAGDFGLNEEIHDVRCT